MPDCSTPLYLEHPGSAVCHNTGSDLPLSTGDLRASGDRARHNEAQPALNGAGSGDALGTEGCQSEA
jgi:hypothetical protein